MNTLDGTQAEFSTPLTSRFHLNARAGLHERRGRLLLAPDFWRGDPHYFLQIGGFNLTYPENLKVSCLRIIKNTKNKQKH